jgi:hypothetical protein
VTEAQLESYERICDPRRDDLATDARDVAVLVVPELVAEIRRLQQHVNTVARDIGRRAAAIARARDRACDLLEIAIDDEGRGPCDLKHIAELRTVGAL